MTIRFERQLTASLSYGVLAKIDLGRDAANLYRGEVDSAPWVARLTQAHHQAGPERLELQFLGLAFQELDALIAHVQSRASKCELWAAFSAALEAERASTLAAFDATGAGALSRTLLAQAELSSPLESLRQALWAPRVAPPLTVFHVPELGRHGRGYPRRAQHLVAVSLDENLESTLFQIFHEEVHPISDPEIGDLQTRDTRARSAGGDVHRRLEVHALRRGAAVVEATAPWLSAAYHRWAERSWAPR